MLQEIRDAWFPEIAIPTPFHFIESDVLACICGGPEFAPIYIHQLLNHPDTPRDVLSLVFKHELLHLRIPSQVIAGKRTAHPPEFWQAEQSICPEREAAWAWIWKHYWPCLRDRPRLERTEVTSTWFSVWNKPKPPLEPSAI